MEKGRILSLVVAVAMIATMVILPVSAAENEDGQAAADAIVADFTKMTEVPLYGGENKAGFVSTSGAIMPEKYDRTVAGTDKITVGAEGASVTESDGAYLANGKYLESNNYTNYGGLIYRQDVEPGAYHLEVTLGGSSNGDNTKIAPTGIDYSRLTSTNAWDTAGHVKRTTVATWNEAKDTWSYDFSTGESFVELDIEPAKLPTADAPQTVTVKSISITPIAKAAAGDKPTIHILGDSTQKTYTFNETISSWGQTLYNYFDLSKVNVINYSMGGRCMRNNYTEGRFNDVLINGKEGDYVFLHSAHNDESPAETRFDRGTNYTKGTAAQNNALYNRWLDMYVNAIKARGMTPVLVSPMPRSAGGATTFNPDSPANMKAKAASDPAVAYVELYQGVVDYYKKLDKNEGVWTYNSVEAGETPANNSANGASGDGTHYREAAAKQFCRIILQSIYDQSVAETDTYNDKAIMEKLVSYMPETVKTAAQTKDWSAVLPEQAVDVDAVDVVPGATKQASDNYYYRTSIEKALQLGALHKDKDNNFKPTEEITVGEFAKGMEKVFGLPENTLSAYVKTNAELAAENPPAAANEYVPVISGPAEYTPGEAQAAADQYTVTVKQVEGGEITVYNNSAFKTATGDVPANVKAEQVFADNDYMTMTAPANIVASSDDKGKFTDNSEITGNYIEFRNASPEKIVKYYSKADGVITVYARFNDNKAIELVDAEGTQSQTLPGEGTGATVYGSVQFNVKADTEYQLWARGGTGRLFGVKYESNDYPQSKESLQVNANDEIRVVAIASDGYLNDKITVDGTPVEGSTGREAVFKVTGDCEVSAVYRSEPAFVDTTVIASDAALTREAMGAVLYDAYLAAYGKDENGNWNKVAYMSQNGGVPSPDDPNYDPNLHYEGSPYIPLVGWAAVTDIGSITPSLYGKVKEAYNLGMMRSEKGLTRGQIKVGDELEPQVHVTRAKAAKALVFCYILTQNPNEESQIIPDNHNYAAETVADIVLPNPDAPSTPYEGAVIPATPTPVPSEEPTAAPTEAPTEAPTAAPEVTEAPTAAPEVTQAPTTAPEVTEAPTATPEVTEAPTAAPEVTEAPAPTAEPTVTPQPLEEQKYDASAPGDVTVTLPETVTEVSNVTANGVEVSEISYKFENGAITFTREFLSSLPNGTNEIIIEDAQGNTYSVSITVENQVEPSEEPVESTAPTPTRRPSTGGGGAPFDSNFSTGGTSAVTPRPAATAEPEASGEPEAPTTAPAEIPTAAPVQGSSQIFEDVPPDYWAYAYIMDLYNSGIINGETATLFAPDDQITRAEFTKMAVILFGITPGGETTFTDVAPTDWYAPYVAAGQAEGIINGTTSTTFSPNDNITREQIAAIVGRRLDLSSTWSMSYSDVAEIEEYAQPYVAALSEQGILTGSDGMFKPKDPATRAEAAAIMSRVKNR